MTACQKCGKELKPGAIRCIHCGSSLDDDKKTPSTQSEDLSKPDNNPKFDRETGVNLQTKNYIAVIIWILSILELFTNPVYAIGSALGGWYWWAPYLAKYAKRHNKNPTWAFFIGVMFGIPGILVYWLWEYVTRKDEQMQ